MRRFHTGICAAAALLCVTLPCVVAAPADGADELGRLFTSRTERAAIDRSRESLRHGVAVSANAGETAAPDPAGPYGSMRVDGVVRRSDGSDELWLNGARAQAAGGVDAKNRIPVPVPGSNRTVWMKPGQVLDASTGIVRESYQAGR